MRKKIRRLFNEQLGKGKKSIEGSEEDFTPNEVTEILRRIPPTLSIQTFQMNDEGRKCSVNGNGFNSVKANGDQAAEYIQTALEASNSIDDTEFIVPHREDMRGTIKRRDGFMGGTYQKETGDNKFEYQIQVDIDEETSSMYGDTILEGQYTIEIRSIPMEDEVTDAVLGNIESTTQTVRVPEEQLIEYLNGQEGEISGRDKNLDNVIEKASEASNFTVHNGVEGYLQEEDGDQAAEFVEETSRDYDQPWSGLIYETDSGDTAFWHMSIPGSKNSQEGTRPEITGVIKQSYERSLEELT